MAWQAQPVGITGTGILASIGDGVAAFSDALRQGRSGIRKRARDGEPRITVDLAAEIEGFSFPERLVKFPQVPEELLARARRLGRRAPFPIQTSIISALEAWAGAGLCGPGAPGDRIGLVVAGQNSTQNHQYGLFPKFREHPEHLSPRYALEFMETNQLGVLSELFGIRGEGFVVGGASATGNMGVIKGFQSVQSGSLDICLVIGVLADLSPMDIQGFINIGAMGGKKYLDRPDQACRPFDSAHEGFIYGQASACVVLESRSSASRRGVPFSVEIKGAAITLDGNSSANPDANGQMRAMSAALERSGMPASAIEYLNTHGTSSPLGDATEAEAIRRVFGSHASGLWLNATKGLTGHCIYPSGLVELIATIEQMRKGFLHPNKNLENPIDGSLRFCGGEAIDADIRTAMSNSFGFGGINSSIIVERCEA